MAPFRLGDFAGAVVRDVREDRPDDFLGIRAHHVEHVGGVGGDLRGTYQLSIQSSASCIQPRMSEMVFSDSK